MQRVLIGRVVATGGAVVVLVGTFLPWLQSGRRPRSSYDNFSLVDRIGYSSSSVVGWALRLWPVVPLLLATTITLLWLRKSCPAIVAGAVAATYAGIVAVLVRAASPDAFVSVRYGTLVTLAGAVCLAAGLLIDVAASFAPGTTRLEHVA